MCYNRRNIRTPWWSIYRAAAQVLGVHKCEVMLTVGHEVMPMQQTVRTVCTDSCELAVTAAIKPAACGHCEASPPNMKFRGGCKAVMFCNRQCQLAHWDEHRRSCRGMRVAFLGSIMLPDINLAETQG